MVRMVKVLEANRPGLGYMAEVPGRPGLYVCAPSLPDLRTKLRAALTDGGGTASTSPGMPEPQHGYSDTALFVSV